MLANLTDEVETSETDNKQAVSGLDEPQSPLAGAGVTATTPEGASPTVEYLKRVGSNTKKLVSDHLDIHLIKISIHFGVRAPKTDHLSMDQ